VKLTILVSDKDLKNVEIILCHVKKTYQNNWRMVKNEYEKIS